MHFTLSTAAMRMALKTVVKAIPTRSPLAILSNMSVRADCSKQRVSIAATDMHMAVAVALSAQVADDGESLLHHKSVVRSLRGVKASQVTFEFTEGAGKLTTEGGATGIPVADPADYPTLPAPGFKSSRVYAPVLLRLLQQTMFAAATSDESRAMMTGVSLSWDGRKAVAVATDGKQLAKSEGVLLLPGEAPLGSEYGSPKGELVIPVRACRVMADLLLSCERSTVRMNYCDGTLFLWDEDGRFWTSTRLLQGQFPQWERVLVKNESIRFEGLFHAKHFERAIQSIMPAAQHESEKDGSLLVRFSMDGNECHLAAGTTTGKVNVAGKGIFPCVLAANPEYLLNFIEVAATFREPFVSWGVQDDCQAMRFAQGDEFLWILMPIRLRGAEQQPPKSLRGSRSARRVA